MIVPVAPLNKPERLIVIAVVVEENKFLYALDGLPLFINVRE
jgi:hypothetical protein